jgi:hypothetical protein
MITLDKQLLADISATIDLRIALDSHYDSGNPTHERIMKICLDFDSFRRYFDLYIEIGGDFWYDRAEELLENIRKMLPFVQSNSGSLS